VSTSWRQHLDGVSQRNATFKDIPGRKVAAQTQQLIPQKIKASLPDGGELDQEPNERVKQSEGGSTGKNLRCNDSKPSTHTTLRLALAVNGRWIEGERDVHKFRAALNECAVGIKGWAEDEVVLFRECVIKVRQSLLLLDVLG